MFPWNRNHSIDLLSELIDWLLLRGKLVFNGLIVYFRTLKTLIKVYLLQEKAEAVERRSSVKKVL